MTLHVFAVMLWALAQVETGGKDPGKVGPHGERGPWQMTAAARLDRGEVLLRRGIEINDRTLAIAHLDWLYREFRSDGIEPSAFDLALAWNAGYERARHGGAPASSYDFAQRVANLVQEKK